MGENDKLQVRKRIVNRHGTRFIWKPKEKPPCYYPIWDDWDDPDGHIWARNQIGSLTYFLENTTIPMVRGLIAALRNLWDVKYEERGKEWHDAYKGCLREFRDIHDAGRHFYNKGRIA